MDIVTHPDRIQMLDWLGLEGKACAEIGTYKGGFAKEILARDPARLVLVDPWRHQDVSEYKDIANRTDREFDRIYGEIRSTLGRDSRVEIIRDFSFPASDRFADGTFDFVYIDAVHTFESVLCDIVAWFYKVRPGGWLCGHDYTSGPHGDFDYPGVRYATEAFLKITNQKLSLLTCEPWATWGIKRPEKKALVTISIGDDYKRIGETSHPTMERYASRIGADFLVIDEQRDGDVSPHYMKFALAEMLDEYDRIVYMDTDMIVREDCPDLFLVVPQEEIGLYDETKLANEAERYVHKEVMRKAYEMYGEYEDYGTGFVFYNTGVIVASKQHRSLFEKPSKQIAMDYWEQPLLNIRIAQSGFPVRDLGYKFNRMPYVDEKVDEHRLESYIIHYAGVQQIGRAMPGDVGAWSSMR